MILADAEGAVVATPSASFNLNGFTVTSNKFHGITRAQIQWNGNSPPNDADIPGTASSGSYYYGSGLIGPGMQLSGGPTAASSFLIFNVGNGGMCFAKQDNSANLFCIDNNGNPTFVSGSSPWRTALGLPTTAAPTISSGFGGGTPTISAPNGALAFRVTIGTASGSTGVLAMPTATTGWNCFANDLTTHTTANAFVMQNASGSDASHAAFTSYSDIMGAATWVNGDVIAISCNPF